MTVYEIELELLEVFLVGIRRRVWDLEQKCRGKSSFYCEELASARSEYAHLLRRRRALKNAISLGLTE